MFRNDKPTASILKTRGLVAALLVLGVALALITATPDQTAAQTTSADARLASITIDDTAIPDFNSNRTGYRFGVTDEQVTVAATTVHSGATWAVVSPDTDADTSTDSFQVDLTAGANTVQVRGTAEDTTTTKDYTVTIDRGTTNDLQWKAADDFNTLAAVISNSSSPGGIWSDGTTMWVSDNSDGIYAFNMATKARDRDKEFSKSQIAVGDTTGISGIWSDGETMWIAYFFADKIHGYDLTTKLRDTGKTINLSVSAPLDIWSDGETIWVVENDDKIHAYNIATESRDHSKEFSALEAAGNGDPTGIWSDGTTMWVGDSADDKIYAYDLVTKARDLTKELNGLQLVGNGHLFGMWGDGSTLWVVDSIDDKIFSYNLPASDDTSLRYIRVSPTPSTSYESVVGLPSDRTTHKHAVGSDVEKVTVEPKARNNFATVAIRDGADDDVHNDGHQVSLSNGANTRTIRVTAQNGDTQDHTLSVNRQVTTDRGWKAVEDFYALGYYGIGNPSGIWSDGETLWVANNGRTTVAGGVVINKLYAFNVATKQRDPGKDFNTLNDAGNAKPWGIWSDGETMWVADHTDNQIFAYDMDTKARDTSKEFDTLEDAGNTVPTDIWSDGETMWVVNGDPADYKIYAYDMATKDQDSDKDFDTLVTANNTPFAFWSDGTTMWVSDPDLSSLYAYKMSDKSRDSGKDIVIQATGSGGVGRIAPNAAWSDGATLWVSDGTDSEIMSFNMTAPAAPRNLVIDDAAHRHIDISWDKSLTGAITKYQYRLSSDNKATWLLDWADVPESDGNTTGYRIQGLSGNTEYVIQLRAVSSRGSGAASELTVSTSETANTDARASSFILNGVPIPRWNPDAQTHYHGVGNTVSRITIETTMVDPRSQGGHLNLGDVDVDTDGHQIDLQTGVNEVRFFTVSESGSQQRTYHVWINRGVDTDFGLNGAGDFHNLGSRDDIEPTGIWSDGETMWLVDQEGDKVHAYNMTTKVRDPDKDFDTLIDAGNIHADGIWSDGETMWVGDISGRVFAYDMDTKARDTTQEFLVSQSDPMAGGAYVNGIWSDGETMWTVDGTEGYISAFKLSDKSRDPDQDFDLRGVLRARDADIWSYGSTMWVAGHSHRSMDVVTHYVYAYSMRTKERDTRNDFIPEDMLGENSQASSLWSDGTTIWSTQVEGQNAIYSYNMPASDDDSLKYLGVDDRAVTAFIPGHRTYQHGVEHTVAQATIVTETQNRYASVSFGADDADPDTDGHQVDLSTGQNEVEITVMAQNNDTRIYTLSVNRGSDAVWGWKAVDDFDNVLSLTGARQAQDIWSNAETMWVAEAGLGGGLFAYDMTTKEPDSAKDVDTFASAGFVPHKIWSDGETMWIRPSTKSKLYGYNLETGARDSDKDITAQDLSANHEIHNYYSDGNTLWVQTDQALLDGTGRSSPFLYAYNWPDLSRRPDKDFTKLHEVPINVYSVWSDGTTIWILSIESHFRAFDVRSKAEDSSKGFGRTLTTGDIRRLRGIWSDGETMWAVDDRTDKIYSFNMPPPSADTSLVLQRRVVR